MPGTTTTPDIEIIVEDIGGGGGGLPPSFGGGDEGDGGDDGDGRRSWSASPKRYSTAIAIGLVSILMFFMALASAFIVLRRGSGVWITVHLPFVVWPNTCVLLASSFTLEAARRRLFLADLHGFRFPVCCRAIDCLAAARGARNLHRQQSGQQFLVYFHGCPRGASSRWSF